MNTPAENESELRCAEYALGVLDADERRALEDAVATDPVLASTLARWQNRFAALAEDLRPVAVPERVWTRIQRDLGFLPARSSASDTARGQGWWNNLGLWRFVGIGASLATLALVAVNLVSLREAPRPANVAANPVQGYMVATIARPDGVAHWTATVDLLRREMVVVPAVKPTFAADRATELWLIPPGDKPISLGVFPADAPARMTLADAVVAQLSARAVLAVSLEPLGGSQTGQPTGPVVATGQVRSGV
ncbi:anti-sigma factor [Paraburkholderia strydomiana]|uniref:anti-sigma factor n=1 Tax=Paraburkholderia strydomiana TaxID=1245417 RepID=UPI0038BCE759